MDQFFCLHTLIPMKMSDAIALIWSIHCLIQLSTNLLIPLIIFRSAYGRDLQGSEGNNGKGGGQHIACVQVCNGLTSICRGLSFGVKTCDILGSFFGEIPANAFTPGRCAQFLKNPKWTLEDGFANGVDCNKICNYLGDEFCTIPEDK